MPQDLPPELETASEFARHLGITRQDWRVDYVRFQLPLAPHLGNRTGLPHGGVHATLLDMAMGYSGCYVAADQPARHALTLSLNVQYLSRPKGQLLIAEGHRIGGGKSTFFAEARVTDDTGELIATGTGVFRYRRG